MNINLLAQTRNEPPSGFLGPPPVESSMNIMLADLLKFCLESDFVAKTGITLLDLLKFPIPLIDKIRREVKRYKTAESKVLDELTSDLKK